MKLLILKRPTKTYYKYKVFILKRKKGDKIVPLKPPKLISLLKGEASPKNSTEPPPVLGRNGRKRQINLFKNEPRKEGRPLPALPGQTQTCSELAEEGSTKIPEEKYKPQTGEKRGEKMRLRDEERKYIRTCILEFYTASQRRS